MAKNIKLGLNLFFSNSSNSGVVNYIYNIISALKTLDDQSKPSLVVFHSADAPIDYIKEIQYPKIEFILYRPQPLNKFLRKLNKAGKILTGRDLYNHYKYISKVDVLYPYFEFMDKQFSQIKHKIHWLVDFNNRAFPEHYADGGKSMTDFQQDLTSRKEHIALSSESLFDELKHYYPAYQNSVSILRFACTLNLKEGINIDRLKEKYDLTKPFFMSPNQFWEHKNQLVLIDALNILKSAGPLNFQVVFTGSMEVNRGKGHILQKLIEAVKRYELEDTVRFLGIISRDEQLELMKNAVSLIQPSLYEGWSTLVEEAKALNQKIILSTLPVHYEQNCVNSYFFDPHSALELSKQISIVNETQSANKLIDYSKNVEQFGLDILKMLINAKDKS
jgi:glycosyltransferase involved in cell wall biosynthesis